jgi:galactose mutarotase-like enzyme
MQGGYNRWQGLCLETQVFPDSILVDNAEFPDFAKGQTPILTPDEPFYHQSIEFTLEYEI